MKRCLGALVLAVGLLYPTATMAVPPPNLHCPAGGTKLQGQGTFTVSGLTLVVSGSTVDVTGPPGAEVQLCVKASDDNTGKRTVTLDSSGHAVFQSDVLNRGGKVAGVSYTVIYTVTVPDACPDVPGKQPPGTDCEQKGSSEVNPGGTQLTQGGGDSGNLDGLLTGAFDRTPDPITGGAVALAVLVALGVNLALRKIVAAGRS